MAAYAVVLGINPFDILTRDKTDYLISIALMKKAMKLSSERKSEEIKVLAELTGMEIAKVISKIF
jgi:hypothetical protein